MGLFEGWNPVVTLTVGTSGKKTLTEGSMVRCGMGLVSLRHLGIGWRESVEG